MENKHADLLAMLRFQEDLLHLTQGLETGAEVAPESQSPVSEFVKIARNASFRV